MRRKIIVGLAVVIYVTNFILFSHASTAAGLAEASLAIPALTDEQLYFIERQHIEASTGHIITTERLYLNDYGHLWIEQTNPEGEIVTSALWLRSPTNPTAAVYTLTPDQGVAHTQQTLAAQYSVIFQSDFYEWFVQHTLSTATVTPQVQDQTEWITGVECYRVAWATPTSQITTWISADSYRLVQEQTDQTSATYTMSIIPSEAVPIALTLPNWLQYYHLDQAVIAE